MMLLEMLCFTSDTALKGVNVSQGYCSTPMLGD